MEVVRHVTSNSCFLYALTKKEENSTLYKGEKSDGQRRKRQVSKASTRGWELCIQDARNGLQFRLLSIFTPWMGVVGCHFGCWTLPADTLTLESPGALRFVTEWKEIAVKE